MKIIMGRALSYIGNIERRSHAVKVAESFVWGDRGWGLWVRSAITSLVLVCRSQRRRGFVAIGVRNSCSILKMRPRSAEQWRVE